MPLIAPSMRSFFGTAEQIAVAPITFEAEPLGVGKGAANAEIARLALAHFDADRDVAVGVETVGLLQRHAVEDFQPEQPVARLVDLFRRILAAALQAGHVFSEITVDLFGALDRGVAVAGNRPGRHGQRHVERRGGVVGNDLAIRHIGQRPAFLFERPHDRRLGFEHRTGTGIAAGDQAEIGAQQSRRIAFQPDVAKREFRPGRNVDHHRNRLRPRKFGVGRQIIERLAFDGDGDDALVAGVRVKCGDKLIAVAARLGQQAERTGNRAFFVGLQCRRVFELLDEILVGVRRLDGHRIAQRIDDIGIFVVRRPPQLDAEYLESGRISARGNQCSRAQQSEKQGVRKHAPWRGSSRHLPFTRRHYNSTLAPKAKIGMKF